MPRRFQEHNYNQPKLRRGQIITTFGPGALVNLEAGSFIGMDISAWPNNLPKTVIYEDRLERLLKVKFFRQPASEEQCPAGLPYRRFPRWQFCPKCRNLKPYKKWGTATEFKRKPLKCPDCRLSLVPMSFLVACKKGHIDDFPWIEWVHRNQACPSDPALKYTVTLSGAGLESSQIECKSCGLKRSMQGAYSEDPFGFTCSGSAPWMKELAHQPCAEKIVTVQRGASNVYFPSVVSSITIPPFTDLLSKRIRETPHWFAYATLEGDGLVNPLDEKFILKISEAVNASPGEVRKKIEFLLNTEAVDKTPDTYRYEEYRAFHGDYDPETNDEQDFKVVPGNGAFDYSIFNIDKVFLVESLREVRALVGFTRLKPYEHDEESAESESSVEKSELVPITDRPEKPATWKPAIEVRGEGIFITFDNKAIENWEKRDGVQKRLAEINRNLEESCRRRSVAYKPLNAKYIMLHTFAHLLIRQLAFESGYSGASLRERIYCNKGPLSNAMQGILIYTAAGDADGTLGGLVRQAEADRLPSVLRSTLNIASWCSNDPLCIESGGQGYESLNLAACYACALLPETSCEEFNKFLDRAFIVGIPSDASLGYFSNQSII